MIEEWDDMLARVLGENLEDLDRDHGQGILDAADGQTQRKSNERLLRDIAAAYRARDDQVS